MLLICVTNRKTRVKLAADFRSAVICDDPAMQAHKLLPYGQGRRTVWICDGWFAYQGNWGLVFEPVVKNGTAETHFKYVCQSSYLYSQAGQCTL